MKVFIHLKSLDNPRDFFTPIILNGVINADADNFSSSEVIQVVNKLITDSNKSILFLEVSDNHDAGSLLGILKAAFKYREKIKVYYKGENENVLMMATKLDATKISQDKLYSVSQNYFKE